VEIVFVLIPLSIVLLALAVRVFVWAVEHRQFDDLDREARRILLDEDLTADDDRRSRSEDER